MSALYKSLDETVSAIREDCEAQLKDAKDKVLASEIRATLLEQYLAEAKADRDSAVRIATKLITQFGLVEKVFADAKELALEVSRLQKQEQKTQAAVISERIWQLPVNNPTLTEASADATNNTK